MDIRSMLVNAAREIVVEGARNYFVSRLQDTDTPTAQSERISVIDVTPKQTDCPYCDIALYLSGSKTYLLRMPDARGDLKQIYRDLAAHRVQEAIRASMALLVTSTNAKLEVSLRDLFNMIRTDRDPSRCLSDLDRVIDQALDTAELTDQKPRR